MLAALQQAAGAGAAGQDVVTTAREAHAAAVATSMLVNRCGLTREQAGPGLQAYLAALPTHTEATQV